MAPASPKINGEVIALKQEYKGMYERFGLNVVYYRKMKRLTQLQLAELLDILYRPHTAGLKVVPKTPARW